MNIVWIFVDSVRRYYSDDDRSRLKIMDKFKKKSIEFTEVVTSAPSTVMSISAMMTGCHAYLLGTNYNDFRFDRNAFPTLSSILKKDKWDCKAILMHPDIREKLTCLDLYPRRKWPKNYTHGKWWSNSDIYNFLKDVLPRENYKKEPSKNFWFIDYNCRKDPKISNIVEDTLNLFYENGYNHQNTIFILCSDHGYPDKSKGITPEGLKRNNMTHDVFMTDDNIMIPFLISFPGFKKNISFNTQISTINILPTILEYLNLKLPSSNIKYARSFLSIIQKGKKNYSIEPYARCDARFLGQSNRVCCIRNKNYKLIYSYEENKFQFNKIKGLDENELRDKNIKKFFYGHQNFLRETDALALEMFKNKYLRKIKKIFIQFSKQKEIKIYLYSNAIEVFNKSIIELINNDLAKDKKTSLIFKSHKNHKFDYKKNTVNKNKLNIKYDLKILLQTENEDINDLLKNFKTIKSKKQLIIPTSLTGEILQGRLKRALKTIWISKILYIYEPFLIIKLFMKFIKNK